MRGAACGGGGCAALTETATGMTAWGFACGVTDINGNGDDKSADGDSNGKGLLNGIDIDGEASWGMGADVNGLTNNVAFRTCANASCGHNDASNETMTPKDRGRRMGLL